MKRSCKVRREFERILYLQEKRTGAFKDRKILLIFREDKNSAILKNSADGRPFYLRKVEQGKGYQKKAS